MGVFEENCRRAEFNAAYDRLQMLLRDGLIDSNHYMAELRRIQSEYSDVLENYKNATTNTGEG